MEYIIGILWGLMIYDVGYNVIKVFFPMWWSVKKRRELMKHAVDNNYSIELYVGVEQRTKRKSDK